MKYPYLEEVSKDVNVPVGALEKLFDAQYEFYVNITKETSFEKRKALYAKIYGEMPDIYAKPDEGYFDMLVSMKSRLVKQFRKEFEGKSILDIGSGSGAFLYAMAISDTPTKELYGLDVVAAEYPKDDKRAEKINFFQQNILDFNLNRTFDTLMMDNVYEHISVADLPYFFNCLKPALKKGTKFILILPHRMFGPADYSRVLDNRKVGKTIAQGLHLNESTFSDVMNDLTQQGFGNFQTTVPFIAFQSLRDKFPSFRLPASIFAWYENSIFNRLLTLIRWKNRPLFRMEVLLIAEYQG